jgi:hypothetical protein
MVGGGAIVLLSYAVLRNFSPPETEDNYSIRPEQLAYMRDLRQRNLDNLVAEMTARGHHQVVCIAILLRI